MIKCPRCGEKRLIQTERRLDGYSACLKCGFKGKTYIFTKKDEKNKQPTQRLQ